jgi:hypothetical protein
MSAMFLALAALNLTLIGLLPLFRSGILKSVQISGLILYIE